MSKAKQFLQLQAKVNQEIDTLGQATEKSVKELEELGDNLTPKEVEEVCEMARVERLYEQGLNTY